MRCASWRPVPGQTSGNWTRRWPRCRRRRLIRRGPDLRLPGCATPTLTRCSRSGARTRRCSGSCAPPRPTSAASPTPKTGSRSLRDVKSLASQHDCLLCDLDGTLFRGAQPTVGAIPTLAAVNARILFITNNASRGAAEVADHLRELGFTAKAEDVVTSAQTAARLLASQLASDSAVL